MIPKISGIKLIYFALLIFLASSYECAQSSPTGRVLQTETKSQPKVLTVYHIGNSITDAINYIALEKMVQSAGRKYVWGRTMIPGAPLQWIFDHPSDGFEQPPYGRWQEALPGFKWDVVTLQPFDRNLKGDDGDVVVIKKFIDLTLTKPENINTQFYLYSRWPRREGNETSGYNLDYATKWSRKYTGNWDGTEESKDYFEQLIISLRADYPQMEKPILMVPVGDVLLELDQRMKAGKIPGFKSINEFYIDNSHFNNIGSFTVGTTFYATMFKTNPHGLSATPYEPGKEAYDRHIPEDLALAIQDAVWFVVSAHPFAGIKN